MGKAKKKSAKKDPRKKPTKKATVRRAANVEKRIDERLVERTLALIEAHEEASEASRRAIGEHLFDEYFGADEDLALSTSPVKAKSFAALASRADAGFGWGEDDLRYVVRIAIAYRSLPSSVREEIPASSLARLASIEDVAERRELAAKIASGELRGDALREAIAEAGAGESRGGRPRLPPALREGRKVVRAVMRLDERASFGVRRLRELDDAQRRELAEQIDEAVAKLRALAAALRRKE
jgi:hypothetical protein